MAEVRLQKYLSAAGIASRRAAEELMREGRVRVNGSVVTELGTKVLAGRDRVEVDGRLVIEATPIWLALHKPPGYVSTRADTHGRRTIYRLIPEQYHGLFYVGRLDRDSEGLMLLTNQGDVASRLLHPRYEVEREYEAEVAGDLTRTVVRRLVRGVRLDDGVARAIRAELLSADGERSRLRLVLKEGRKREIRRMLDKVGFPVRRLVRTAYGPVRLGRLEPGKWRSLKPHEVVALEAAAQERER
jgi:23S rRNA pseudouridine2605 synthase